MIFEEYCLHGIGLGAICEKLNGDLERYPPPKRNPKDEMPLPRRGVGRSFKPCSETPKYTGARTPSALRPSPGAPSGSGGSRSFVPPAHREAEDALEVEQAVAVLIEMHGVLRLVAQASSDAGLRRVRQLGVGGETMEAVELVNARAGVVQDAVHYVAPPRRVRKFGRGRFAGESCRRPGRRDWRIGWPPSRWRRPVHPSPSGLERKTRPAERRRSRRSEHRLDRELHQRREGRANLAVTGHPDSTEKSLADAHAPARVALLCPPLCKVAAEIPEATGSGFPWKSATTEFMNPTGGAGVGRGVAAPRPEQRLPPRLVAEGARDARHRARASDELPGRRDAPARPGGSRA